MTVSWVVQASPLSKLFMPEWHARIEEDPQIVFKSVPFKVVVPRTSGALIFEHNKPLHINKILPKHPNQKKDEYIVQDLDNVVQWLTGGEEGDRCDETDIYGIVGLNIDMDISAAITEVALSAEANGETSKKALKTYQDMQQELLSQTRAAMASAQEKADARVRRAVRVTHMNLKKSWQDLVQDGKGKYPASIAEAVGGFILEAELSASGERRKKMLEKMNSIVDTQISIG